MAESKFLKVCCPRCRHMQLIFGKASTNVKCDTCNIRLVHTQGGKARIRAEVRKVL
ncbi:MAG: 30S ribosomal protein S27e [Nanoarchaeota archaeon]